MPHHRKLDPAKIIRLIRNGKRIIDVSKRFNCNHASIYYWLRKYGVRPIPPAKKKSIKKEKVFKKPENQPQRDTIFDEGLNKGKNYNDYLLQEQAKIDPIDRARKSVDKNT